MVLAAAYSSYNHDNTIDDGCCCLDELVRVGAVRDKQDARLLQSILRRSVGLALSFRANETGPPTFHVECTEPTKDRKRRHKSCRNSVSIVKMYRKTTFVSIRRLFAMERLAIRELKTITLNCCVDLLWVVEPLSDQIEELNLYSEYQRKEGWKAPVKVPVSTKQQSTSPTVPATALPLFPRLRVLHLHRRYRSVVPVPSRVLLDAASNHPDNGSGEKAGRLEEFKIDHVSSGVEEETLVRLLQRHVHLRRFDLQLKGALASNALADALRVHPTLEQMSLHLGYWSGSPALAQQLVRSCLAIPNLQRLALYGVEHWSHCEEWITNVLANSNGGSTHARLQELYIPLAVSSNHAVRLTDAILHGLARNRSVTKFGLIQSDQDGLAASGTVLSCLFQQNHTLQDLALYYHEDGSQDSSSVAALAENRTLKRLRLHVGRYGSPDLSALWEGLGTALASQHTALERIDIVSSTSFTATAESSSFEPVHSITTRSTSTLPRAGTTPSFGITRQAIVAFTNSLCRNTSLKVFSFPTLVLKDDCEEALLLEAIREQATLTQFDIQFQGHHNQSRVERLCRWNNGFDHGQCGTLSDERLLPRVLQSAGQRSIRALYSCIVCRVDLLLQALAV